jgi:hypothetical protein
MSHATAEQTVPQSAHTLREYRDGLKLLSETCERCHNELLYEVEDAMKRLKSAVLERHFRDRRQRQKKPSAKCWTPTANQSSARCGFRLARV